MFSALKEILSDFNLIFLKIQTVSNYGLKNYFTSFKIPPIFSNRIKTDTVCA